MINKKELINTIDNIIDELKSVKNAIQIDNELDEVRKIQNEKIKQTQNKCIYKESEKTLIAKSKQKIKNNIINEDPNRGYKDYYDPFARPEMHI